MTLRTACTPSPSPLKTPAEVVQELVTKGIGALLHIQQRALRAFSQDGFASMQARFWSSGPMRRI